MRKAQLSVALAVLVVALAAGQTRSADYALDTSHAGVTFKISHLGLSWTYGRFNDISGNFTIDPADASKSSFDLTIKADSVDTGNAKRDGHLKAPDFLNVKQYPTITFKSTAVKEVKGGLEVTGDFTMHGTKKSIKMTLVGGEKAEFPKGVKRTGYSTDLTIKRSDYGMDKLKEAVGDNVVISISFEGTEK